MRDKGKLLRLIGTSVPAPCDRARELGDASQTIAAMTGHDVVINAAGYVTEGRPSRGWCTAIDAASAALGEGGRFWQLVAPPCSTSPVPA